MFSARVEVEKAGAAAIAALQADLRSMQGMSGTLGRQLVERVGRLDADQNKQTFASQQQPGGGAWKDLSPEYAKRKAKERPGRKILVYDGNMRTSATTARAQDRIARVAGDTLELGTSHHLARIHQFGKRGIDYVKPHHRRLAVGRGYAQVRGHAKRVNLPARPFIGKSASQDAAIRQAISLIVAERASKYFARLSRGRTRDLRLGAARKAGRLIVVER